MCIRDRFNTLLFAAAIADKMSSALIQPFGQDSFWRTKSKQQQGLSTPPPYDWVHSHFKKHMFFQDVLFVTGHSSAQFFMGFLMKYWNRILILKVVR